MDKILLLGGNGQVGWELSRSLLPLGRLTVLSRHMCDLTNDDKLVSIIRDLQPDIIVNAAAYTNVDKAETDGKMAGRINAKLPAILAEEAKRLDALLIDYSTDYVFDGTKKGAYVETDASKPINVYGRGKLEGLQAIQQSGCRYLIFRVSWVYGSWGNNFVKTMLQLGKERTELKIVADQTGSPTPADLIADVTAQAISLIQNGRGTQGLYNLVPGGVTSWYGFAEEVFSIATQVSGYKAPELFSIESSEYSTPAQRPGNSCLNTEKLQHTFGFYMPPWQTPLKRIIEEIIKT